LFWRLIAIQALSLLRLDMALSRRLWIKKSSKKHPHGVFLKVFQRESMVFLDEYKFISTYAATEPSRPD
jgi:hypothetical protein